MGVNQAVYFRLYYFRDRDSVGLISQITNSDTSVAHRHRIGTISVAMPIVHKIGMTQRDDIPRHNLRLTRELKAKLGHASIDNGRSMNAEILARLERSFAPDPAVQLAEALSTLKNLSEEDLVSLGDHFEAAGRILAKGHSGNE